MAQQSHKYQYPDQYQGQGQNQYQSEVGGQPEGRQYLPSEGLPEHTVYYPPPANPSGQYTSTDQGGYTGTGYSTQALNDAPQPQQPDQYAMADGQTHGAQGGASIGAGQLNNGQYGSYPQENSAQNYMNGNGNTVPQVNGSAKPTPHSQPKDKRHHSIMQETDEELTEDELIEYEKGIITWDKVKNWRYWLRREWLWWYIIFIVLVVLVALMAFFHHSIIDWLSPFVKKLRSLKAGFVIPAAILFVLSFPPLFGNEIVMVLVGVVWGLGKGFAIVVVGICLGEICVFLMFRYLCHARAERMTRKSLNYACLSEAIREGGFVMAFIVRLSVIPTHFTTAVFAVCGLKFWQYLIALFGGLPKQLISVYVGVVLGQTNATTNSHVISDCVFGACAIITLGALWFIYKRMIRVRKRVLIGMRDDLKRHNVQVGDLPEGQPGDGTAHNGVAAPASGREWDRLRSSDISRNEGAAVGDKLRNKI